MEFRSILFIPGATPSDLFDNYYQKSSSLRLYVRKVLISDEFEDLMPRYLNFIKGLVDSDDLPLNVSRENLQQHKILKVRRGADGQTECRSASKQQRCRRQEQEEGASSPPLSSPFLPRLPRPCPLPTVPRPPQVIGKKLVRKVLEMIRKLATDQKRALAEAAKGDAADADAAEETTGNRKKESEPLAEGADKAYTKFWESFGKNIKLGVIEDSANRSKLAKLLRFKSTATGKEGWRSLEEYVAGMKAGQKSIYYIAGESFDAVSESPFLERLKAAGLEVLFMTDPIDEYAVQNLPEFDGHRLQSITKEGLTLPGDGGKVAKAREEAYAEKYKGLIEYLKKVYGDKVEKVVVSSRLATSPCILVTSQYGYSANMERIMKSQAFADQSRTAFMVSKKTMEINPRHPIVAALAERAEADPEAASEDAKDIARLLFDTALLNSGFTMDDPKDFAARMYRLMRTGLSINSLDLLPEVEVDATDDEPEAATGGAGEEADEEGDGGEEDAPAGKEEL